MNTQSEHCFVFSEYCLPPNAEKGKTMDEEKKVPELEEELESVEDDEIQDVAGGVGLMPGFRAGKPIGDEPEIPGIPYEDTESDGSRSKLGVKR